MICGIESSPRRLPRSFAHGSRRRDGRPLRARREHAATKAQPDSVPGPARRRQRPAPEVSAPINSAGPQRQGRGHRHVAARSMSAWTRSRLRDVVLGAMPLAETRPEAPEAVCSVFARSRTDWDDDDDEGDTQRPKQGQEEIPEAPSAFTTMAAMGGGGDASLHPCIPPPCAVQSHCASRQVMLLSAMRGQAQYAAHRDLGERPGRCIVLAGLHVKPSVHGIRINKTSANAVRSARRCADCGRRRGRRVQARAVGRAVRWQVRCTRQACFGCAAVIRVPGYDCQWSCMTVSGQKEANLLLVWMAMSDGVDICRSMNPGQPALDGAQPQPRAPQADKQA